MLATLKKIFDKKKSPDEAEIALIELGSAIKKSEGKESLIGYFGGTGFIGNYGTSGTFGFVSPTKSAGFYKLEDEIKITSIEPQLSPPGSYPDCPVVMFQTQEWIQRPYLKPIGRSRITGETIYKYTGFKPYEDLDSIDINHYELI